MTNNKKYDVIVIGGGVGGTGVAELLSKKGLKVMLVEPIKYLGGRCSSYEKDGFKVPTYVHAFARVDRGPCQDLARQIGETIQWGRESTAVFMLKDREIHSNIAGGPAQLNVIREAGIPFSEVMKVGFRVTKDFVFNKKKWDKDLEELDVRSWLLKYTDNANIHALAACVSTASFVVPYWEAAMGEFVQIVKDIRKAGACGYPMGECGDIAETYVEAFKKFGGDFRQERVSRIMVEDNCVKGVELKDGEKIEAPVVISNTGIKPTVLNLVGEDHFDGGYIDYVKELKHSWSGLVVKVALEQKITDMKACMYMPSDDPVDYYENVKRGVLPDEMNIWVTAPANMSPSLAPPGKQLLCAGSPVPYIPGMDWKPWVERSFQTLEKLFPDIPKYTLWKDSVTPEQINKWVGKEGTVIGIAQCTGQVGKDRPSIESSIDGLYFVGSDVGKQAIGVELAAESAMRCANLVEREIKRI